MRVFRCCYVFLLFHSCSKHEQPVEFVKIPGGTYTLGSSKSLVNQLHIVTVSSFYIATAEVTNAQFNEFIESTNYITTAEKFRNAMTFYPGLGEYEWVHDSTATWRFPFGKKEEGIINKMNHPVTCVSYIDALAYCKWKKVRLPTLDEWEIACRAGSSDKHFFSKDNDSIEYYGNIWLSRTHAYLDAIDTFLYTSPVRSFKPNAWGLYDVYGNCFEFCSTRVPSLQKIKNVACARGGSWWCSRNSCNYFNSLDIGRVDKIASFSNQGFRVVKKDN